MTDKYKSIEEMGFKEQEISFINNTFAGNPELLDALFSFMIQKELTASEASLVKTLIGNEEVVSTLKKRLVPDFGDNKGHFYEYIDPWQVANMNIGLAEEVFTELKAAETMIRYFTQQLALLGGGSPFQTSIKFADLETLNGKQASNAVADAKARLNILKKLTMALINIRNIAGAKIETIDEMKQRILEGSNK